ncbi:DNA gyrase subunit A [Ruminococcus flavefaciens]|uniref:DNA gyrase subunit A n=1 Tax=Ruminococcus flavefaciens TaxID=1265 RepID=UPI0026F21585|nr:DNA gyrase subunit A [Ruminococcus flavefaciens]MDD7516169.1 DNA gyrase subunit A [Ruminococcus flavefaciens]MDY5692041.1 DNA gyrase subunit A [Ruminococcus flavefaciens]
MLYTDNSKVINTEIVDEMENSMLNYAMSVIVSRALPDVRDGLKPVHRRILYTLHENGLTPEKPYRKCADTVGAVLGRYHPHGDASVYDALVRLAQDFSMRYPLVDGHGNFGSIDGDGPAAYRYTEAKMAKLTLDMLTDINKETVDFTSNYDDRLKEPVVLPSRFPNLLVNGSVGIAVGMATNIPPHNLGEVIDALALLIDDPDCTLEQLMEHIQGPDFPTGGIIMGRAGIRAAYGTGKGKITLRSRTHFEEIKGRNCIIIDEIPYMLRKERLLKSINQLARDKRIEGLYDLRDESDKDGMRVVIELKKDAVPNIVLNKLFALTQLQDTVGIIMLALVNGEPKILTLKQMLQHYLDFQVDVIQRRTRFDLRKALERAHILQGFVLAADYIDEVIAIIRSSATVQDAKSRMIERFKDVDMSALLDRAQYDLTGLHIEAQTGLSEEQAEAIVQMRLGQLTGLERQKITDELYGLLTKISDYEDILADVNRVYAIILDDLNSIRKKFSDKRRTDIENVSGEVDIEDLIPEEDCVVTLTNNGYIKRMPLTEYKTQHRGGRGITGMKQREEDFVEEMFICGSHDNILFISNKGIMYKLKCYEVPDGSKASRGFNLINLLPLTENEKIAAMIKTTDFSDEKFITIVTKNGKIKRTNLSLYKNVRKNGLIAIGLDEGDEIAGVRMTDGNAQLFVATHNGMAIRLEENKGRALSRSAHGVRAIKLRDGDYVVSMARVREGATLLTVTENGYGKRTEIDSYRIQNRGGYGLTNYKVDDIRGHVCGIKIVDEEDDIILVSSDGIIIRILASDIRVMGRIAKGVRVMRVNEGANVVAFTRAEHDDNAETEKVEQLTEEQAKAAEAEAALEEQNEVVIEADPEDEENEE